MDFLKVTIRHFTGPTKRTPIKTNFEQKELFIGTKACWNEIAISDLNSNLNPDYPVRKKGD